MADRKSTRSRKKQKQLDFPHLGADDSPTRAPESGEPTERGVRLGGDTEAARASRGQDAGESPKDSPTEAPESGRHDATPD